jgi:AbrB family looped-hinge helix DNA binding protein
MLSALHYQFVGRLLPVQTKIDALGRIVVPKAMRDALGLEPGSVLDISLYGAGIQLQPGGRTARLVERDGRLVAEGSTAVTQDDVLALLDAGRR